MLLIIGVEAQNSKLSTDPMLPTLLAKTLSTLSTLLQMRGAHQIIENLHLTPYGLLVALQWLCCQKYVLLLAFPQIGCSGQGRLPSCPSCSLVHQIPAYLQQ